MSDPMPISFHDPRLLIWGFHVHQELPLADFPQALAIQSACESYLNSQQVKITANDAIAPGYGPHLNYLWELRVEEKSAKTLQHLGLAISYLAVNRQGLSAYIHPLMHDPNLPTEAALAAEGRYNQNNTLWFSHKVQQNQNYFFNPDKDANNEIIDTRTPRILSSIDKSNLLAKLRYLPKQNLPEDIILRGFHLHVDYQPEQAELALLVYQEFLAYLSSINLSPTSHCLYGANENGPHLLAGWEIKFETEDKSIFQNIGIAVAWLMCNRQNLSVFMHPVTWQKGDVHEEYRGHADYSMFIGELPPLDLSFFSSQFKD